MCLALFVERDARIRSPAVISCAGESRWKGADAEPYPKPPKPTRAARPAGREHRSSMRVKTSPRSTKSVSLLKGTLEDGFGGVFDRPVGRFAVSARRQNRGRRGRAVGMNVVIHRA